MAQLECGDKGLTTQKATELLGEYGTNTLPTSEPHLLLKFASYFWNPLSWTMEVAVILSVILAVRNSRFSLPWPKFWF